MKRTSLVVLSIVFVTAALFLPGSRALADICGLSVLTSGTTKAIGDNSNAEVEEAQSFIAPASGVLQAFDFKQGSNTGSPTGNIHYKIAADNNAGRPGQVLASGDVTSSPNNFDYVNLSNGPSLFAGKTYWMWLYADAQATNVYFNWQCASASTYADGSVWFSTNAGSSWSDRSLDCTFEILISGTCQTATPDATSTPSDTPTPTVTPSPTPNYSIEITATSGAPMKLERSATYGDLTVFAGLVAVSVILFLTFAYNYWRERINADIER
jgi:hypothetical protein